MRDSSVLASIPGDSQVGGEPLCWQPLLKVKATEELKCTNEVSKTEAQKNT